MIEKLLGKLSLKSKLSLSLIVIVMIPLVVVFFIYNTFVKSYVGNESKEKILETLKQTYLSIGYLLDEMRSISMALVMDENLQKLGQLYADIEPDSNANSLDWSTERYRLELKKNINSLLLYKNYISSVHFSNTEKTIYHFGQRYNGIRDPQIQQKSMALKGRGFWLSVNEPSDSSEIADENYISYYRTVHDISSPRDLGFLEVTISETAIHDQYKAVNTWNNAHVYIVDENQTVISSPETAMIGRSLSSETYVNEIFADTEGFYRTSIHHHHAIVFYYTIAQNGWKVVLTVPENEFDKRFGMINVLIIIAIFIFALFGLLFSYIQDKSIVLPLKKMVIEMRKIQNGDFNINLQIKNQDEIGILGGVFKNMAVRLKEHIEKEYISQLKQKEAELAALQAQINPHFLYNTLDSIRWTAYDNNDVVVYEQLGALSDIFRHRLNKGNEMTTIRDEVKHVQDYIQIQQFRFGDRLKVDFDIDEALLDRSTLKLILQPIVENAIYHGIEKKLGEGRVDISIRLQNEYIQFIVKDNGVGIDEELLHSLLADNSNRDKGYALKNIHERIQLKYGKDFGVKISSKSHEGTTVEAIIPGEPGGKQDEEV